MVGYLSISHLGYCLLGLFAVTATRAGLPNESEAALSGVFLQMFNHGLTAAALFYFVGLLERRRGARGLADFGGLMQHTPQLCGWMSVAMFSSLGLPGLNSFVGEFLIFKGAFALAPIFTAVAVLGLLFTVVTMLRAMQSLFSGPLAASCLALPELRASEKWVVVPVTLPAVRARALPAVRARDFQLHGHANGAVVRLIPTMKNSVVPVTQIEKHVSRHDGEIAAIIDAIGQWMAPQKKSMREIGCHAQQSPPRSGARQRR